MRQYRGRTKGGKWVYGEYISSGKTLSYIVPNDAVFTLGRNGLLLSCIYSVIPKTVGQSTGLKDKSDKEIYEGDKLRTPPYKWEGNKLEAKEIIVKWYVGRGNSGFTLPRTGYSISWEDCEIIGNVHQPELSEKSK